MSQKGQLLRSGPIMCTHTLWVCVCVMIISTIKPFKRITATEVCVYLQTKKAREHVCFPLVCNSFFCSPFSILLLHLWYPSSTAQCNSQTKSSKQHLLTTTFQIDFHISFPSGLELTIDLYSWATPKVRKKKSQNIFCLAFKYLLYQVNWLFLTVLCNPNWFFFSVLWCRSEAVMKNSVYTCGVLNTARYSEIHKPGKGSWIPINVLIKMYAFPMWLMWVKNKNERFMLVDPG